MQTHRVVAGARSDDLLNGVSRHSLGGQSRQTPDVRVRDRIPQDSPRALLGLLLLLVPLTVSVLLPLGDLETLQSASDDLGLRGPLEGVAVAALSVRRAGRVGRRVTAVLAVVVVMVMVMMVMMVMVVAPLVARAPRSRGLGAAGAVDTAVRGGEPLLRPRCRRLVSPQPVQITVAARRLHASRVAAQTLGTSASRQPLVAAAATAAAATAVGATLVVDEHRVTLARTLATVRRRVGQDR